jgi:phenolic acid decarboxylase
MGTPVTIRIWVNIYTDSKFAFTTTHVHGALYKEKGLINSGEKIIKYEQEILKLLDAVWLPKQVTFIHYQGHQKGDTTIVQGKWKRDKETKQMTLTR